MNKIQLCVIQIKYTACMSKRVNDLEYDISVFFTVEFCSVEEFDRSGIVFDWSLEEMTSHHNHPNM